VGISFAATPGEGAYIPLTHRYAGAPAQLPLDQCSRAAALARGRGAGQGGAERKYDRHVFANHGVTSRGFVHDTLLQSYVLQSHQRHDMDALATRFLGASGCCSTPTSPARARR
jgi:DNA polymerase-1